MVRQVYEREGEKEKNLICYEENKIQYIITREM